MKDSRADVNPQAGGDSVVYTGRMPSNIKKSLRVVSARSGMSQSAIMAAALSDWFIKNGYAIELTHN